VVLPFENGSPQEADAYLSEGFSDELRDQLSRVPGLRVVARPSSIVFRGQNKPASLIAKELGVATVVEGSFRKDGDSLGIVVRLIDGTNDTQLWSQRYDRRSSDLLAIQQEVALAASQQILPQVDPNELPHPEYQASVTDLMLLARNYQQKAASPEDWDKVVTLYRQVLELDPESALAHARLALALLYQGKDVDAAERQARLALSINPNLAEAHAVLGHLLWVQFRAGGSAELRQAVELNPNDTNAQYYYGAYLSMQSGKNSDALMHLNRARELDPSSLLYIGTVATTHAQRGNMDEVTKLSTTIQERFPDAGGKFALSRILDTAGQLDEAIAWAMEAKRLDPRTKRFRATLQNGWRESGSTPKRAGSNPSRRCGSCSGSAATTRSSNACRTWTSTTRMPIRSAIWRSRFRRSDATPRRYRFSSPWDYRASRWTTTSADGPICITWRSWRARCAMSVKPGKRRNLPTGWISSPRTCFRITTLTSLRPAGCGHWWKACALAAQGKRVQALTEVEVTASCAEPRVATLSARRKLLSRPARRAAIQDRNPGAASASRRDPRSTARHADAAWADDGPTTTLDTAHRCTRVASDDANKVRCPQTVTSAPFAARSSWQSLDSGCIVRHPASKTRALSDTSPPTTRHPSYRGPDPFIFVCYSHREEELIEAEIAALAARGIRIKYDEGIEPGEAWQDEVADAIETCRAFLIFVSKHSVVSHDCRRELTFALSKKRPVVAVHLDDLELPSALRLQLGDRQAIIRSRFTEAEYRERLTSAMLKYQNAPALDPDASELDGHAPIEAVKNRRRRGPLVAALLAVLAITAVTWVAFRPQISDESQVVETPAKQEGIVILPFENGSGRDEDAYLSEGFSDELRDQLSRVRGLRVVARPSSVAFRGNEESTSTIAKKAERRDHRRGQLAKSG
jgi:TolB-like protein/Tfp pilus assembly protein PilF